MPCLELSSHSLILSYDSLLRNGLPSSPFTCGTAEVQAGKQSALSPAGKGDVTCCSAVEGLGCAGCCLIYFLCITSFNPFFFFFFLFKAKPAAYGGSQVRGLIGAAAAGLRHNHSNTGSKCICHHATACGNARSLTYGEKPGIEPASSCALCWVLNQLSHNGNAYLI